MGVRKNMQWVLGGILLALSADSWVWAQPTQTVQTRQTTAKAGIDPEKTGPSGITSWSNCSTTPICSRSTVGT